MKRLLFAVLLAACSSKSPQASSPPAPPPATPVENGSGSATMPKTDPLADKNPGIGEKCGPNDACAQGLTCVSYYGIAGAKGPQFKTCEIKCDKEHEATVCPKGTHCATIADGPGSVCR